MPRFRFDLHEQDGMTEDSEGRELPNGDDARLCALRDARDIMAHDVKAGALDLAAYIRVINGETGESFDVSFLEALSINYSQPA